MFNGHSDSIVKRFHRVVFCLTHCTESPIRRAEPGDIWMTTRAELRLDCLASQHITLRLTETLHVSVIRNTLGCRSSLLNKLRALMCTCTCICICTFNDMEIHVDAYRQLTPEHGKESLDIVEDHAATSF
ncbi:hypothetical protein OKW31_001525 [Paraburkholderia atlantica]